MADIKKIKGQYYDFDDYPNPSFTQTARELKAVGVKNYYHCLRINNPKVAYIDPWNPKITEAEQQLVLEEASKNLWYYSRYLARLVATGLGVVPIELHRGLHAAYWCYERCFDFCLCEPRQTYKTTGILAGPIGWTFQVAAQYTNIMFFGKESKNTQDNLNDLKDDINALPPWMRFTRYINPDDGKIKKAKQIAQILQNPVFKNEVTITPKPSNEGHAASIGRGSSVPIQYFDEIEHMIHFPIVFANAAPAFMKAAKNARSMGQPAVRVFTTTPGNLDIKEGREAMPVIKSMIPFSEKLYDMDDEGIDNFKSAYLDVYHEENPNSGREVVDIFYIEYQYSQLRLTHDWVNEQYKKTGDKHQVLREILMKRQRGGKHCPIDPDDLQRLISNMKKSLDDLLVLGKWRFLLYPHGQGTTIAGQQQPFDPNIPYMIGVDPAAGAGGDNCAITIVNPRNLQIAAEFRSKYINGPNQVKVLVELINNYMPKAVIIPEKNSMGYFLVQMLRLETSCRDNLYWNKSSRTHEEMAEELSANEASMASMSQQESKYGTFVSKKVRDSMQTLFLRHVSEHPEIINTEYLVDDICNLVQGPTGKIAADKGQHDDSWMSWNHILYVYYTGDNLDMFGIDNTKHPLRDSLEPDIEDHINARFSGIDITTKVENITFTDLSRDAAIQFEEHCKHITSVNPRVFCPVYGNTHPDNYIGETDPHGLVDISPAFFDQLNNGVYDEPFAEPTHPLAQFF